MPRTRDDVRAERQRRAAPDGRLTYPPVEGGADCLRCGLLRYFGARADDVLLDHINGHPTRARDHGRQET